MNKNTLKNFAINARLELLARVRDRATLYGITDEKVKNNQIVASNTFQKIDGQLLSKNEIVQRNALLQRIQNNGYVQVMEEAAYTWFNRFIAIKYMEVHKLLPVDQRVIPQQAGELPQIVREAQNLSLEIIDLDTVIQYLDSNRAEELYKYLVISLCNQLSGCLPQMFEKISDYTELLFPDGLMKAESFLGMLANVDDENWQEIQVIGWLYQYYNTDLKDETFDLLKKNVKISKERIGAATQLFTPEWIVRYMVENSLGRLWYEGHTNESLKAKWRYYLDEAQQEPEVEKQIAEIRKEREKIQPESIRLIDPCMGSGHILVYAFDVLMDIYRSVGYTDRDAVHSIIVNNIFGLDIDNRAAQLAYFALMMKAAEYDKRFLKRNLQPNVCAIQESNSLVEFDQLKGQMSLNTISIETANKLISIFIDAKEYGSILNPHIDSSLTVESLMRQLDDAATNNLEVSAWYERAKAMLPQLARQAIILNSCFDVVVTNPPYMGATGMSTKLSNYVKQYYPDTKSDLSTVFMERCLSFCKDTGMIAMINIPVWMFLTSYEKLRFTLLNNNTYINMVHPGRGIFGSDFGTTTFVIAKRKIVGYKGCYYRLFDRQGEVESVEEREKALLLRKGHYVSNQDNYLKIPGVPVAYWISEAVFNIYRKAKSIEDVATPKQGFATTDNDTFLRLWFEIDSTKFSTKLRSHTEIAPNIKWVPYNKGGAYRPWYGNLDYVCRWENAGEALKSHPKAVLRNLDYQFKRSITWSLTNSSFFGARYREEGSLFDTNGMSLFASEDLYYYLLSFLCSKPATEFMKITNPTLASQVGDIARLPIIIPENQETIKSISELTEDTIKLSKDDWDSFETSWDFQIHPLIAVRKEIAFGQFAEARMQDANKLERCFAEWETQSGIRFDNLKKNEEELNHIFINIYGLGAELTPDKADKDVTIRKANLERDIRSLISYAIGCMFGRYSLDVPGLAYAGGSWDASKYVSYPADRDGILPITDDEYFQDDVVSMFIRWVKTVYGAETLEDNLQFIAKALNPNGGTSREVIRSYFLNDFYSDHLKIYQKRPIYWQFDSGKQNGFKALIYIHRYDQDTVARLRTDYVHELQDRYRTQLEDARKIAESGDARQRSAANKRAQKLDKQLTELNKYEELVHHYADMRISLDLDDGVKVNYAKLQDILTKIK